MFRLLIFRTIDASKIFIVKKILLFSTACFVLSASAQSPITLTGADLPAAGKSFVLGNDTSPGISLGLPGSAQQSWDFTSLTNHYFKAAVYDSTAITGYQSEFPASNIYTFGPAEFFGVLYGGAPVYAGDDGYTFWRSDTTGLWVIGFQAIEGAFANRPVHTSPPELLIGAPATYGTSFTDTSRWQLFVGDVPANIDSTWITRRYKTLTCDAWGSLSTPFGNFTDVIRIRETVTHIDSIVATLNSLTVFQMELRRETSNNYMYMANGIGYPLATVHADVNNNIKSVEYVVDTTCSIYAKIMGTIADSSGNAVTGGMAYLYQFINSLTPLQIVDSVAINSSGYYVFINVYAGSYLVSAQASLTGCPGCIPTYNGSVSYWMNGTPISTYCVDTVLASIFLTQLPNMIGNAIISGILQYGIGGPKTEGAFPVAGARVMLENLSGDVMAFAASDQNGSYSFADVEPGDYRITVDIPGLPMDSTYYVTVTAGDSVFTGLNFMVDTTAGSAAVYVDKISAVQNIRAGGVSATLAPNPFSGHTILTINNSSGSAIHAVLTVHDLTGKEVMRVNNITRGATVLSAENLSAGMYFYRVVSRENLIGAGKMVISR